MSLDFPTLCLPITMNWGIGKLRLSTCSQDKTMQCNSMTQADSWVIRAWGCKRHGNCRPFHPVLLWLHRSSSANAFSSKAAQKMQKSVTCLWISQVSLMAICWMHSRHKNMSVLDSAASSPWDMSGWLNINHYLYTPGWTYIYIYIDWYSVKSV